MGRTVHYRSEICPTPEGLKKIRDLINKANKEYSWHAEKMFLQTKAEMSPELRNLFEETAPSLCITGFTKTGEADKDVNKVIEVLKEISKETNIPFDIADEGSLYSGRIEKGKFKMKDAYLYLDSLGKIGELLKSAKLEKK